jgi:hypothetical protein
MLDINTLAAWGEFIGGIAVVVSLIYLAGQIRQNSKLLRTATSSASAQITYSNQSLIVQDDDVARIYWDGMSDRNALSEADRRRFDPLLSLQFQGNNQLYESWQEGVGSPAHWEVAAHGLRWQFQQPGVRQYWREWGEAYPQAFRDFVDGLIREAEAAE